MKWDTWRGSGKVPTPSMWIKNLPLRVQLHKIIKADEYECFHTHPYTAIRIILWGGYVEELENKMLRVWRPGAIGVVTPSYCHRVHRLIGGDSYSLWIRFKKVAEVELRGSGWN